MQSDTPRTDSQFEADEGEQMNIRYGKMIQHARGLEREIAATKKAISATLKFLEFQLRSKAKEILSQGDHPQFVRLAAMADGVAVARGHLTSK